MPLTLTCLRNNSKKSSGQYPNCISRTYNFCLVSVNVEIVNILCSSSMRTSVERSFSDLTPWFKLKIDLRTGKYKIDLIQWWEDIDPFQRLQIDLRHGDLFLSTQVRD